MSKFDQYQTFIAVVEQGSLAKAANQLNLSPSAVSKQLSGLEEQLKVQLVDRSTRSLAVTELGKKFYTECRRILKTISQAESRLKEEEGKLVGKISLSCPKVLLQARFVSLIQSFTSIYEDIKIDLSISDEIEDLVGGKIDFAFRIGKLKDSRLHAIPLLETRPIFCTSKKYIDQYGKPSIPAELRQHNLIIPTYLNLSDRMRTLLPVKGPLSLDLEQYTTTNDAQALLEMIKQGFGITVMLDLIARDGIDSGELIDIFPSIQLPKVTVYLLYHKQNRISKKVTVFKEYIKENITNFL